MGSEPVLDKKIAAPPVILSREDGEGSHAIALGSRGTDPHNPQRGREILRRVSPASG
jgi:hypothetical protein